MSDPYDLPQGMSKGYIPRDRSLHPHGSLVFARPFDIPLIPRSEWDARIAQQTQDESSLWHLKRRLQMKSLDQNGTNYCWINAGVNCVRLAYAFTQGITPDLSPASCGGPITGYRNQGGDSSMAIEYLSQTGVSETKFWPANAISSQYDTAESKASKAAHRVTKWLDLRPTFDEVATCLLLNKPVSAGLSWWSHEICYLRLIKVGNGYGVTFWNSWSDSYGDQGEGELGESKARPDDATACEVVTPV